MECNIKRIVVPTDFSPHAAGALNFGAMFANHYGAELDLVTAVDTTGYHLAGYLLDEVSKHEMTLLKRQLEQLKTPKLDCPVSRVLLEGSPAARIVDHATSRNADMLAMGTQGRGAIAQLVLGSVTERVIHAAPCPVLVTRQLPDKRVKATDIRRVLCPTDFSATSTRALKYAHALAQDFDAQLHLLHVIQERAVPLRELAGVDVEKVKAEQHKNAEQRVREQLKTALGKAKPDALLIKRGDPVDLILDPSIISSPDLIVIGTHGRTGLERLLMGSVARKVIRRAECPVFLVRPA